MMDYNEWSNYTALGYLKYALEHYQKVAAQDDEYRVLTEREIRKIIGCMRYSFDMKTLKEKENSCKIKVYSLSKTQNMPIKCLLENLCLKTAKDTSV